MPDSTCNSFHSVLFCKQVLARILYGGTATVFCVAPLTFLRAQVGSPVLSPNYSRANPASLSGRSTQEGSVGTRQAPATVGSSVSTLNSSTQIEGAYQGSVPAPGAAAAPASLSLAEAVKRGLAYNLGTIGFANAIRQARGQRYITLSQLLPNISGYLSETAQQTNLAALGLHFNAPLPGGFSFPTVVGPFNYFDLRAALTQNLLDVTALRNYRASREYERATELSALDARDLVVLAVSGSYLQAVAAAARIEAARAQVATAQALYTQAVDRHNAGLTARIDVTRSQVELQSEQNRLTSQLNDFAKQKIILSRLIGVPVSQDYSLTDTLTYTPLLDLKLEEAISRAAQNRKDVQSAQAQIRAAEQTLKAARAEYLPVVGVEADYGVIGPVPSNSHGTFGITGSLRVPLWQGGRVRGDIEQADAALAQRRAEYEDLRQRVEADVRNAFLDLSATAEQVRVAQSNQGLAQETLQQARDRFQAGVSNTVEVVQAQQAVAAADQDYIASLVAHNLAKASVARAVGGAEQNIQNLLKGR